MARRKSPRTVRRAKIAREFARTLKKDLELGPQIRRIVLFGSVARGDDHRGSDIDLLVEVRRRTPALETRIFTAVADLVTREGELVVPIVVTASEERRFLPNYLKRTIRDEGKTLG